MGTSLIHKIHWIRFKQANTTENQWWIKQICSREEHGTWGQIGMALQQLSSNISPNSYMILSKPLKTENQYLCIKGKGSVLFTSHYKNSVWHIHVSSSRRSTYKNKGEIPCCWKLTIINAAIPKCQSPAWLSFKTLKGWGFHPPTSTQFLCQSCQFFLCNIKTENLSFGQWNTWWRSLRKTTVCRIRRSQRGNLGTVQESTHCLFFLLPAVFYFLHNSKGLGVEKRES